jgi:hypothetical protein
LAAAAKLTAIVDMSSQPMMTAKVMNIRFSRPIGSTVSGGALAMLMDL